MDNNQIIILIDALVYVLTFIYWAVKLRKLNVGLILLAIMTFSHVGAIFYYTIVRELGLLPADIKVLPFVYLYVSIMLCLLPFLKYKGAKQVDDSYCKNLITFLTFFVIAVNIEPFFENLNLLRSSGEDYSELYEDMRDGELDLYSSIGKTLAGWSNHFRLIVPILFFYHLTKSGVNWKCVIGLGMCMVNMILYWVNMGTRGGIVSQMFMYILAFILFVPVMSRNTVSKIKKVFLVGAIPCVILFVSITFSRYNSKVNPNKSLIGWLLLYTSEGPIKFNTEMWDGPHNTNGDVNTNFLKDLVGLKTYTSFEERDDHYMAKNGRRIEVFYTYVGDFISDYSYVGGIVICLFLYGMERKLMKKNGIMPFHYFVLLLFVAHLYSIGFASNIYRSYGMQKGLFYMLIILLMFDVQQKLRLYKHRYDISSDGHIQRG